MGAMGSQTTSLKIVYSTVNSGTVQRKHESSASRAFVRARTNSWTNKREAGDLRRHCAHYDAIVMEYLVDLSES